jgi:hypothetical protein
MELVFHTCIKHENDENCSRGITKVCHTQTTALSLISTNALINVNIHLLHDISLKLSREQRCELVQSVSV